MRTPTNSFPLSQVEPNDIDRFLPPLSTSVRYKKSDPSTDEIRLLRLLPVAAIDKDVTVRGVLEYVSLGDPPPYNSPVISMGGSRGHDTDPRWSLRASCHLLVWVDAICINQRDLRERSEQITRMAAIYQCADIVIAWLGDDVQVENTALPMMEETYRYGQKDDDDSVSNRCDDLEHDQAMIKFFENPYWRRVWIIQELAFGRNIKLVCGSKAIPFDCLSRTIKRVNGRKSYSGLHVLTSCEHVGQILTIRSKIEASQPISLMEAMMRASRAECTDVRDRIYGLLGLAFDRSKYIPVPSYHVSAYDVCLRITRAIIPSSFFTVAMFGNSSGNLAEPTWVPNWLSGDLWEKKRRNEHMILPSTVPELSNLGCRCGYPPKPFLNWIGVRGDPDYSIQRRILGVRGRLLGTIRTLSSTFDEASLPSFTPAYGSFITTTGGAKLDQLLGSKLTQDIDNVPRKLIKFRTTGSMPASLISHRDLFKALFWLLTFYHHCCPRCEKHQNFEVRVFRQHFWPHRRWRLRQYAPLVRSWLDVNGRLDLSGHSLRSRVSLPKSSHDWFWYFWPKVNVLLFVNPCGIIPAVCYSLVWAFHLVPAAFNKPQKLAARMQTILEMGMRLATYDRGLGWVDPMARPGDQIGVLQGCKAPVVLRAREGGGWNVVGDAIIDGARKGISVRDCGYLDIY